MLETKENNSYYYDRLWFHIIFYNTCFFFNCWKSSNYSIKLIHNNNNNIDVVKICYCLKIVFFRWFMWFKKLFNSDINYYYDNNIKPWYYEHKSFVQQHTERDLYFYRFFIVLLYRSSKKPDVILVLYLTTYDFIVYLYFKLGSLFIEFLCLSLICFICFYYSLGNIQYNWIVNSIWICECIKTNFIFH